MKKNKVKSKKEVRMLKLIKNDKPIQKPVEIILNEEETWFSKALKNIDKGLKPFDKE